MRYSCWGLVHFPGDYIRCLCTLFVSHYTSNNILHNFFIPACKSYSIIDMYMKMRVTMGIFFLFVEKIKCKCHVTASKFPFFLAVFSIFTAAGSYIWMIPGEIARECLTYACIQSLSNLRDMHAIMMCCIALREIKIFHFVLLWCLLLYPCFVFLAVTRVTKGE